MRGKKGSSRDGPTGLVRVEAASYEEALRKISNLYGDDVSIVHTRVVKRRGMLGALGAKGVQVYITGGSQYREWRDQGGAEDHREGRAPAGTPPRSASSASKPASGAEGASRRRSPSGPAPQAKDADPEVLGMLRDLQAQISSVVRSGSGGGAGRGGDLRDEHPIVKEAHRILEEGGFSPGIVRELLERISHRRLPAAVSDLKEFATLARIHLGELLGPKVPPCIPIPPAKEGEARVVAMVGPTGVGKTTTIAKLASPLHLVEKRQVGLVTLDTYRLGAVDQLRRFADILALPLKVVQPGERIENALGDLRGCDVIFVDTAGRSQKDARRLAEIRDMLAGVGGVDVHLCISLAAARETILEVARNFRVVPYNRLLITKLDESARPGVLLDLFQEAHTPLSYVTCGQEVPEDIQAASLERLLALLLGEK